MQPKHVVALTQKMIAEGLSLLCKTGDGLAHAFVRLDVTNRYAYSVVLPGFHGPRNPPTNMSIYLIFLETRIIDRSTFCR